MRLQKTIIMSPEAIPSQARARDFATSGILSPEFRGPIEVQVQAPSFPLRTPSLARVAATTPVVGALSAALRRRREAAANVAVPDNTLLDNLSPDSFGSFKVRGLNIRRPKWGI